MTENPKKTGFPTSKEIFRKPSDQKRDQLRTLLFSNSHTLISLISGVIMVLTGLTLVGITILGLIISTLDFSHSEFIRQYFQYDGSFFDLSYHHLTGII
jgi:hypothetical protein